MYVHPDLTANSPQWASGIHLQSLCSKKCRNTETEEATGKVLSLIQSYLPFQRLSQLLSGVLAPALHPLISSSTLQWPSICMRCNISTRVWAIFPPVIFYNSFIPSFRQLILMKHLSCARHRPIRPQGYSSDQRDKKKKKTNPDTNKTKTVSLWSTYSYGIKISK